MHCRGNRCATPPPFADWTLFVQMRLDFVTIAREGSAGKWSRPWRDGTKDVRSALKRRGRRSLIRMRVKLIIISSGLGMESPGKQSRLAGRNKKAHRFSGG